MTVSADQLRDVMVGVAELEKRVNAIVSPPLPLERVAYFDPATSAVFFPPDLQQQTPTWVNGGADFWCCGVGYTVWWTTSTGTRTLKMHDLGNGMGWTNIVNGVSLAGIVSRQVFDFRWGMQKLQNKTGRTFSYLASPGGGDSLLSRQALGNQETGRILRFNPWKIATGDSVVFTIRPIGYDWSPGSGLAVGSTSNRFTVTMTMYGFTKQAGAAGTGNGGTR